MDLYSGFFIQFMYAMQHAFKKMETFVFSTKLSHISSFMKKSSFAEVMKSLAEETGWSGGTKIGESLKNFLDGYSKLLSRQTIVIILSDGCDTAEGASIEKAMRKIRTSSKKVIWLNPLAGYSLYQPEARGMQAALPFVDVFVAAHNVESLRNLGRFL